MHVFKRHLAYLFFLSCTLPALAQQNPSWQPRQPGPILATIAFSVGSNGYWSDGNELWKYSPASNNWIEMNNLPYQPFLLMDNSVFVIQNEAYFVAEVGLLNEVYKYNESKDQWNKVAVFPGAARWGGMTFVIGQKAYLVGGVDKPTGSLSSDVWEFDTATLKWSQKNNFPFSTRYLGSSFSIQNKGYIGTGLISAVNGDKSGMELFEYSPENDKWIQKANLPGISRFSASGFSNNQYGYILAGDYISESQERKSLNEFWRYNPVTNAWDKMPNFAGGNQSFTYTFVIGSTCYSGNPSSFYAFSIGNVNCAGKLSVAPPSIKTELGNTIEFKAVSADAIQLITWQSDFGQGFQSLRDYGSYSGTNTASLRIANVQLGNHNQPIRVIASLPSNCLDTSDVVRVHIADTCTQVIIDTTFISVTDTLVIRTTVTDVHAVAFENTIKVFPNPASTHITIDYGDFYFLDQHQLRITNAAGQLIYQTAINRQRDLLSLSTWGGKGLYFIFIIDPQGNTSAIRKIVVH